MVSVLSSCGSDVGNKQLSVLLNRVSGSLSQPCGAAPDSTPDSKPDSASSASASSHGGGGSSIPHFLPLHTCCCLVPSLLPALEGASLRRAVSTLRPLVLGRMLSGDEAANKAMLKSILPTIMSSAQRIGGSHRPTY